MWDRVFLSFLVSFKPAVPYLRSVEPRFSHYHCFSHWIGELTMMSLKRWWSGEERRPDSHAMRSRKYLEQLEERGALHRPLSTDNPERKLWSMSAEGAESRLDEGNPVTVDVAELTTGDESEAVIITSHKQLLRFVQAQNGTPGADLFSGDEIEALRLLGSCEQHGLYDPALERRDGFLGLAGETHYERLCRFEALEKLGRQEEVLVRGPSGREATIASYGDLSRVFEKTVELPDKLQQLRLEEQETADRVLALARRLGCRYQDLEQAFELISREREQAARREVLEARDASLSVTAPESEVQQIGLTQEDLVTVGNFDLDYNH